MRNEFEKLGASTRAFWREDCGQDLIENTLLMGAGGSIKGIWSTTNSQLVAANTSAS
jgi:hypothetical protein